MNERIFDLSSRLNSALMNDPKVKELNKLEEELNNSYEVYLLSQKKDEALELYTKLKEIYPEHSKEVKDSLKKLKEAKENLSNHPLVKTYLSIYTEVRDLYMEVDDILFSDFKRRAC